MKSIFILVGLLVKEILDTQLEFPAVAVAHIGFVRLGRILAVHLVHGEYRFVGIIHTLVLQDLQVVGNLSVLRDTPLRVQHVTEVDDISRELQLMLRASHLHLEVLSNTALLYSFLGSL